MYNANMRRTQIYIDEKSYRQITLLAQERGSSMAETIRKVLQDWLKKQKKVDYSGKSVMQALANLKLKGGPKDLSTNLDHYLYGAPKKKV